MATTKRVTRTSAKKIDNADWYECICCGDPYPEDEYYKSPNTEIWNNTGKRVTICKSCLSKLFTKYTVTYNELTALKIICAYLDVVFSENIYDNIIETKKVFSLDLYMAVIARNTLKQKGYTTTVIDNKNDTEDTDQKSTRWSKSERQNMNFVLSIVGYNPFDDNNLSEEDKKYCFNILAGYCDDDSIQEDGHKIQSVVQMTYLQLQCRKIDELINGAFASKSVDEKTIKDLTTTKKQIFDSINALAKDNNISSNYSARSSKGASTLSYKMKEMSQNNFDMIKVSLYDIKTSQAIKQINDISNQSIFEQIGLDTNEYTSMIKEQRELLQQQFEKGDRLEEENRKLRIKIKELNGGK